VTVTPCDIPLTSVLDRNVVDAAYFCDAYCAALAHPQMSVADIFAAIFAHHPMWMRVALMTRNRIATWCGLDAPSAQEILNPQFKRNYAVGDTIGVWPIYALTENELVAGRDNTHLDFRVSVLKLKQDETASVVMSTICTTHNRFGKLYLFFIIPFHRWGVQRLMLNAIRAGRL
jgi:hypothetical protein